MTFDPDNPEVVALVRWPDDEEPAAICARCKSPISVDYDGRYLSIAVCGCDVGQGLEDV